MVVIKIYSRDAKGNVVADYRGESAEEKPKDALPHSSIYFTDTSKLVCLLKDGTWKEQG